jgi:hypothetical protein
MTEVEKPPSSHMKDSRPTPISQQHSQFESRRDSKKCKSPLISRLNKFSVQRANK